jgi:hypothetical protein
MDSKAKRKLIADMLAGEARMRRIVLVLVVMIVATSVATPVRNARGQETPWTAQDAMHEVSDEAAQCVAYYTFAQRCAARRADLATQLGDAREMASKIQFMSGRAAGMSIDAMLATLKLAFDDARNAVGNTCVNMSILIVRDSSSCKFLLEHLDDRIQTLMLGPPEPTGR